MAAPGKFAVSTGLKPPPKPPARKPATIVDKPKAAKAAPKMTGAFKAPPISRVLGAAPLRPANGAPLPEDQRVAVALADAQAKVERMRLIAANERITANRVKITTAANFAADAVAKVAAQHGLTAPGQGFGNVGTAKHANTFTPDLTAAVAVARGNQQRLAQGGLLSPKQDLTQALARDTTNKSAEHHLQFDETHQLPTDVAHGFAATGPAPQEAAPAPPKPSGGGAWGVAGPAPGAMVNPREALGAASDRAQSQDALSQAVDLGEHQSWGTALKKGDKAIGTLLGTGLAAAGIGSDKLLTEKVTDPNAGETTQQATNRITEAGLSVPHGLPVDVNHVIGGANNLLRHGITVTPAASASTGATASAAQAAAIGFTPAYTKVLMGLAKKQGWYDLELQGLTGLDLLEHAYSKPPVHGLRELQNFGTGVGQTAGVAGGFAALGTEIAQGHGERAFGQLGHNLVSQGSDWLSNPLQAALSQPFNVVPAVGALGKTAGALGYLKDIGKEMPMRELDTGVVRNLSEEEGGGTAPLVYNRGPLDKNLWTQAGQKLVDRTAKTSFRINALHGHNFDKIIRRSIDETAHGHYVVQQRYATALRGLAGHLDGKKQRAEILLGYLSSGGKPELELKHFEARAAIDGKGSSAAAQVAFLRDKVIPGTKQLSAADQHFLETARDISKHSTATHVSLDRFRAEHGVYRQHEHLIEAHAGEADRKINAGLEHELTPEEEHALQVRDLRQRVLDPNALHAPYKSARLPVRSGKIKEAESGLTTAQNELERHQRVAALPKPARPPKGSGAEAQAKWHSDLGKWRTKTATARAKASVAERQVKDRQSRLGDLHEADRKQFEEAPNRAEDFANYGAALHAFAQRHVESGGIEPARVEYTKTPASTRVVRGTGAMPIKKSAGKAKASSGSSFRSGNFRIDSTSPLRESIQAQRLSAGMRAYKLAVAHTGSHVPANYVVKPGEVAMSEQNLRTLANVETHVSEGGVSAVDAYRNEHSLRTALTGKLEDTEHVKQAGDTTVRPSIVIPEGTYKRMLDYSRPVSRNAYDRVMRQYQRTLVSLFPGTMIGNTLGSAPLAMVAGAGAFDARNAARVMGAPFLHNGQHDLVPHTLFGAGPAGGLAGESTNLASKALNQMRSGSVYGEDATRIAAYFHFATPVLKIEAKRLIKAAGKGVDGKAILEWQDAFDQAARSFAKGEFKPEMFDHVLDQTEKFMGHNGKPTTGLARTIEKTHAVLFQNWVGHMLKLVLFTLPVKHPRRMLFLNSVAQYGEQYREQHGVWPSWMDDFFPVIHEESQLPGGAGLQKWTHAFSILNANPQQTAGGVTQSLTDNSLPWYERIAGVANPAISTGIGAVATTATNAGATYPVNLPRALLASLLGQIPGERKIFPMGGMTADSLPWSMTPKTYISPYTHQVQPGYLSSATRPDQGWSGILERIFGVGGYQVPNEGPITNTQIANQAMYNLPSPSADVRQQIVAGERKAAIPGATRSLSGP